MRNLKYFLILIVLLVPATAGAVNICSNVTATGAQAAVGVANLNFAHWDVDIILAGTVTAAVVRIEGNQGGDTFSSKGMATHTCDATELSEGICSFSIDGRGANKMRCNVTTLTGTNAEIEKVQVSGRP